MPPSLDTLKTKLSALLVAIASKLDTKLDKTAAAVSADKLSKNFTLSLTGDAQGSASLNGSTNVGIAVTFPNVGTAGTYPKVTVNAKGQVLSGDLLLPADIPALDAAKVTTGVFNAARIPLPTKLAASRTFSMTGDGSWSASGDLSTNVSGTFTLANSGVTAGAYGAATQIPKLTVDAKGRVTAIELVDIKAQTAIAISSYVDLAANTPVQYDLRTLLGSGYTNFDLKTAEICVRAKDNNGSSPMYGAYANAEGLVSYGIKDERYIVIANQSNSLLNLYVKVLVHPK